MSQKNLRFTLTTKRFFSVIFISGNRLFGPKSTPTSFSIIFSFFESSAVRFFVVDLLKRRNKCPVTIVFYINFCNSLEVPHVDEAVKRTLGHDGPLGDHGQAVHNGVLPLHVKYFEGFGF
jgi:hypothetical protein